MRIPSFIAVLIGVIVGSVGTFVLTHQSAEAPTASSRSNPEFAWSYESFDANETPRTTISLIANYSDGANETKTIDTIAGDCNDYDSPDADVYARSTMIICYYAGLGHYYKVIEADGRYAVQRKVFEEASPDYDPSVNGFETIQQF